MSFSRETTKKFGGRTVKIGDKAKAHMRVGRFSVGTNQEPGERLEDFVGVVGIHCSRVDDDEPVWLANHEFGKDVSVELNQVWLRFVEDESKLVRGTWTWGKTEATTA